MESSSGNKTIDQNSSDIEQSKFSINMKREPMGKGNRFKVTSYDELNINLRWSNAIKHAFNSSLLTI